MYYLFHVTLLTLLILSTSVTALRHFQRRVTREEEQAIGKAQRNKECCDKNWSCCVKVLPPPIELRAIIARCPNLGAATHATISRTMKKPMVPEHESRLKSFQGFDEDEPLLQSRITQCHTKVLMTVKLHHKGQINERTQYLVVDHVFDPVTDKLVRILHPYVIRLTQFPVEKLFHLKFVDYANSEAHEEVHNKQEPNYTGCYTRKMHQTCNPVKFEGHSIPFSEGFCCSCDMKKNIQRQPDNIGDKTDDEVVSYSDPSYLLDRVGCPHNFYSEAGIEQAINPEDTSQVVNLTTEAPEGISEKPPDSFANRISEYPFRGGEKLEDTVAHPKRWKYTRYMGKQAKQKNCKFRPHYLVSGQGRNRDEKANEAYRQGPHPKHVKRMRSTMLDPIDDGDILTAPLTRKMRQTFPTNVHKRSHLHESNRNDKTKHAYPQGSHYKYLERLKSTQLDPNEDRDTLTARLSRKVDHKRGELKGTHRISPSGPNTLHYHLRNQEDNEAYGQKPHQKHSRRVRTARLDPIDDRDIFTARLARKMRQTFPSGIQKRGGQNCADRYTPPGLDPDHYHESTHCLRYSDIWYGIYKLAQPVIDQNLEVAIFQRYDTEVHAEKWREITNGTITLTHSNTQYEDELPSVVLTLTSITLSDPNRYANWQEKRILIPEGVNDCDTANFPEMRGGPDEFLVVGSKRIAIEGDQCDTIGVGFEAFYKQPNRCALPRGTCLHNQPKHLWRNDKVLERKHRKGCFFLKYHANITADPLFVNETTGEKYLSVVYEGAQLTNLDIEIRADQNPVIRDIANAVITEVYIDSTCAKVTSVSVKVINTGLVASKFMVQLSDFPLELPEYFSKIHSKMVTIAPQMMHIFNLEIRQRLPTDLLFCSAEVLNKNHELVALRRIRIQRSDRCICAWYCLCACVASVTGLKCNPMSLEHYHAAGFEGSLPIVTYLVHFTMLDDLLSVSIYFILFLLAVLLLLGLCKAVLGICIASVGIWGLSVMLDLPKPMKRYYERHLRKREVIYDEGGWPVDPDTHQRVRNIARATEFGANFVFFFTYPLACSLIIFRRLCCPYTTRTRVLTTSSPPQSDIEKSTCSKCCRKRKKTEGSSKNGSPRDKDKNKVKEKDKAKEKDKDDANKEHTCCEPATTKKPKQKKETGGSSKGSSKCCSKGSQKSSKSKDSKQQTGKKKGKDKEDTCCYSYEGQKSPFDQSIVLSHAIVSSSITLPTTTLTSESNLTVTSDLLRSLNEDDSSFDTSSSSLDSPPDLARQRALPESDLTQRRPEGSLDARATTSCVNREAMLARSSASFAYTVGTVGSRPKSK